MRVSAQQLLVVGKVKLVTAGPWVGTCEEREKMAQMFDNELHATSIDSNVLCSDMLQRSQS